VKIILNSFIKIDNLLKDESHQNLENKILADLKSTPKKISSTLFYDEEGSRLFEEITNLPEYYLTRTEKVLLKKAALCLSEELKNIDIIEFGSGDCSKISIILDNIPKINRKTIRYIPFDVSIAAVEKSSNILTSKFPDVTVNGIVADFLTQLNEVPIENNKLICFLGSTIGNFSMKKALHFLIELSKIMHPGDLLLIGFDMVKNKEVLERAYNDRENVTEKFNKNILNVVNRIIGTDFNSESFKHVAFYNEDFSRIEMHLEAIEDLEVNCPGLLLNIYLKKGERIHTENSHKFTIQDINNLASSAGLEIQNIFIDDNKWFSLVHMIKRKERNND